MTDFERLVLANHKIILHAIHILYCEHFGPNEFAHEVREQQQRVIDFLKESRQ